jgi:hypothetical protein
MLSVPVTVTRVIVKFAPVFSKRVWEHAQVLVVGALLAPGKRTVSAVLRVMGLSQERHFQNYHRVLNRARWSSLATACVLLELVVHSLAPSGVVVIGLDDTLERRRRGGADQGQGHLSRPGALLSHGAVSLRTLSSATGAAAQEPAAVGGPTP